MKTIYILWLRQIKRHYRSKSRVLGSIAQPMLFLLSLGFGFNSIFAKAGAGDYINFLVPGIIGMTLIFTSIFSGMEIIWDRQFGFLKEILVAPVSRLNIMIGRTLGGASVAVAQGILIYFLSMLVGFKPVNWYFFPLIIGVMMLIALLFTALGTMIASRMKDMHGFQLVMNFLVMPLFFLSGALYPLDNLPQALTMVASANPLSYGVDALRTLIIGSGHYGIITNIAVLSVFCVLFLVLGTWSFNKMEA